jgi:hypothetical protein
MGALIGHGRCNLAKIDAYYQNRLKFVNHGKESDYCDYLTIKGHEQLATEAAAWILQKYSKSN